MFPSGDLRVWTSVTGPCFGAHDAIRTAIASAVSIFFISVVLWFRSPIGVGDDEKRVGDDEKRVGDDVKRVGDDVKRVGDDEKRVGDDGGASLPA